MTADVAKLVLLGALAAAQAACAGSSSALTAETRTPAGAAASSAPDEDDIAAALARMHYPSPPCRRDTALVTEVETTLKKVLAALQRSSAPVTLPGGVAAPWTSVAVNDGGTDANILHVELVIDAWDGSVDEGGCLAGGATVANGRDAISVEGLCEALPVPGAAVLRCSAEGLAALTADDRRRRVPSAALTYVLAHELSHLMRGHGRHLLPVAKAVDLAIPADAKWNQMAGGCGMRDDGTAATLGHEQEADRDAIAVLTDVVLSDARADPTQSQAVSVALASMSIWTASGGVEAWERQWLEGATFPAAFVDAPLDPDDRYVAWSADRMLCDVLDGGSGHRLVPVYNATHPSEAERLASISTELARSAPGFHAVGGPLPAQVQQLTARLGGINAIIDVQRRKYEEKLGTALCARLNLGKRPDCAQVAAAAPIPVPSCPRFDAPLDERPIVPATHALVTRRVDRDHVVVDARVRTALELADGTMFVGTEDPPAAAFIGAAGTHAWRLPCTPTSAVEVPGGVAVVCDAPLGVILLGDAGPRRGRFLQEGRYDDEPVRQDMLKSGWLGEIGGTLHATVHLPAAGKSTLVRFDDDAVRSALPWRGAACDQLHAGMEAFRFDPRGPVFATTWDPQATTLVVELDAAFSAVEALAHPSGEPVPIACGAGAPWKTAVCVDESGAVFAPLASGGRKVLARFTPPPGLARARTMSGRVCSSAGALHVQVAGGEGDAAVNDVFSARPGAPLKKTHGATRPDARLECGPHRALVLEPDGGGTTIIRL